MTTLWVWGTGWVTATLVSRQRASGLDWCGYSGGPRTSGAGPLVSADGRLVVVVGKGGVPVAGGTAKGRSV